jgi:DNA-binding response OmpR family regulator
LNKVTFIIEDEQDISRLMKFALETAGHTVHSFDRADPAFYQALQEPPSLFLLDIMLPGGDGLELCRRIRESSTLTRVPIIFVSAKISEEDRVHGLESGADDYITKPFSPRELVARAEAVLRRSTGHAPAIVTRFGNVEIDSAAMIVRVNGEEIQTTTLEFRLLEFLARSPGLVFSRDRLLEAVWGNTKYVSPRSVDVYVSKLREKIETDPNHPQYLLTVRGAGYRLMMPRVG